MDIGMDTILATDVMYDLKVIRPFLETVSRTLLVDKNHCHRKRKKKHLILSHVPRWFLPRDDDDDDEDTGSDPARTLERHIVQEASRCGLTLIRTVRLKDIQCLLVQQQQQQQQQQQLLLLPIEQQQEGEEEAMVTIKATLLEELTEMEHVGAVLWVFEKEV